MRSRLSLHAALLCLLSTLLLSAPAARAADDTTDDEYEEHARVLRVSLTKGEVSLLRAGESDWESARLNTPLVEGDTLSTGRDSRLEIQADSRNFIRVGPDSVLKVVTLRDEGIALSISEGTATFRLSRFDKDKEYFEVDAPRTTVAAERTGQYRIDVLQDGAVRVTVREDARARVYSNNSGFELRSGRTASLYVDNSGEADWELSRAADFDGWDLWNREREQYLAARLKYEGRERYYDQEIYGAEELDLYGDWSYTSDYGYVWRPHTTVVNNYYNWAPYRYGRWVWCNPYGWTWVADEDWGWAPYHYGRWVYYNGGWCWAPRGYGYNYGRAWWRPALVTFVNINIGNDRHVCWYPLTYGQRDPRGRWWTRRNESLSPLRRNEIDHLRRANPALLRAVTTARAGEFGAGNLRARPAAQDLAQRALNGEPVLRGQLPAARPNGPRVLAPGAGGEGNDRARRAVGREGLTVVRPAPVGPARTLPDRDTGAAARTPGVPLDSELRRTRVFNNREPRVPASTPSATGTQEGGGIDSTGAVTRPDSPRRGSSDSGGGEETRRVRPVRTAPPIETPRTDTDAGTSTTGDSERVRRREPDTRNEDVGVPRVRPTRPRDEQPPVNSQPREVERPSAPPVINRPEPRTHPREDERPSSPPPRREDPAPSRHERSAPPPEPRREAPPPRQEQPRQETPRQEAPRHESPRQEAPRQERPRESPPQHERPKPAEVKARQKNNDQR